MSVPIFVGFFIACAHPIFHVKAQAGGKRVQDDKKVDYPPGTENGQGEDTAGVSTLHGMGELAGLSQREVGLIEDFYDDVAAAQHAVGDKAGDAAADHKALWGNGGAQGPEDAQKTGRGRVIGTGRLGGQIELADDVAQGGELVGPQRAQGQGGLAQGGKVLTREAHEGLAGGIADLRIVVAQLRDPLAKLNVGGLGGRGGGRQSQRR